MTTTGSTQCTEELRVCLPAVYIDGQADSPTVTVGTLGAQAAVPIVAAVAAHGIVTYAEVVTSMSSATADSAARAGIDCFIETTAAAIESVGGAQSGKAILLLNPAEPPVPPRHTVYCLLDGDADWKRVEAEIEAIADAAATYVRGYHLKQRVQFEAFGPSGPLHIPEMGGFTGTRVTALIEIGRENTGVAR